ncbi:hypothetical protein B0H14DRAFT_3468610 [Mycena olivaceomarginata]|nr:hypothetical protein B0H14DRAFT_3468610 [Mycena olivaceomarginata]
MAPAQFLVFAALPFFRVHIRDVRQIRRMPKHIEAKVSSDPVLSGWIETRSVQAAVASLPNDTSPAFILIAAGTYQEAVNVSRKGPTTLLGQTAHPASYTQNLVTIFNTIFINQTTQNASIQDNADSAVLTVAPNKYAAWTGAGYYGGTPVPIPDDFGSTDFKAYNINFEIEL